MMSSNGNRISKIAGRWIAERRRNLGISQEYIASQLLRTQSYWSKIEAGERSVSLDDFTDLCQVLGEDPAAAFQDIYKLSKGD